MSLIEASSSGFKSMADGTVRFSFDVEPRAAEAALRLFRTPGTPAVIGRLVEPSSPLPWPSVDQAEPASEPVPPKSGKRERMGPLCEWAVYRCKEEAFQRWITPIYDRWLGGDGMGTGDIAPDDVGGPAGFAAHAIKVICGVDSRKELDDEPAKTRFRTTVMEPYAKWLKAQAAT